MAISPDLTNDELQGLEITDTCGCSICRLGREVTRRRAELPVIASIIEQAAHAGGLSKEGYAALTAAIARSDGA